MILIGCAAALSLQDSRITPFWRRVRERRIFSWITLAAACGCILFVTGGAPSAVSWRSATFGYTLAGSATAMLVTAVFLQPAAFPARMLSWGPLVSLGTISYGVYLFHLPIARLILDLCRRMQWPDAAPLSMPLTRYVAASITRMSLTGSSLQFIMNAWSEGFANAPDKAESGAAGRTNAPATKPVPPGGKLGRNQASRRRSTEGRRSMSVIRSRASSFSNRRRRYRARSRSAMWSDSATLLRSCTTTMSPLSRCAMVMVLPSIRCFRPPAARES